MFRNLSPQNRIKVEKQNKQHKTLIRVLYVGVSLLRLYLLSLHHNLALILDFDFGLVFEPAISMLLALGSQM